MYVTTTPSSAFRTPPQNLAAGVRKEADNNPRLRLLGQLSGILHAEDYQDGKGDMMMEALKALFPTDQIKERLEGSPEMPTSSLAFATLAAFTSKYYFTDEVPLMLPFSLAMDQMPVLFCLAPIPIAPSHRSCLARQVLLGKSCSILLRMGCLSCSASDSIRDASLAPSCSASLRFCFFAYSRSSRK